MFFTLNIGFRSLTCYAVDGVSEYNNWFIAGKRFITVTAYDVKLVASEASSEPMVHYGIDEVLFKSPYTYHVHLPSFNEGVVRRIVEVAEEINRVPQSFRGLGAC